MRAIVHISGQQIEKVEVLKPRETVIYRQDPIDSCTVVADYLIPGLLDTGVRLNSSWEDLTQLTLRALQGGVTGLFVEEGIHHKSQTLSNRLFSDIFLVKTIQHLNQIDRLPSSHAFKIYVSDPSAHISSVNNIQEASRQICLLGGILIIDCTKPYRMMLNSPLRYEPVENRNLVTFSISDEIVTGYDSVNCLSEGDDEESDMVTNDSISVEFAGILKNIQSRKNNHEELFNFTKESYLFDPSQAPPIPKEKPSNVSPPNPRRKISLTIETTKISKKTRYKEFLLNYPDSYETNGIKEIFQSVEEIQARIHLSGLSSSEAVFLSQMRKDKYNLTLETSVPYLASSAEKISPYDTRFKLSPPIRCESNRRDLWKFVQLDSVDVISSKHEYVPLSFKSQESQEFQRAVSGFPTLGHSLSLVWTAFLEINPHLSEEEKDRELVKIVKKMSQNIAERFGIEGYGKIQAGCFANLVVFNPEEEDHRQLYEDHLCPYEGSAIKGSVKEVYLRGNLAFCEGESSQYGSMFT